VFPPKLHFISHTLYYLTSLIPCIFLNIAEYGVIIPTYGAFPVVANITSYSVFHMFSIFPQTVCSLYCRSQYSHKRCVPCSRYPKFRCVPYVSQYSRTLCFPYDSQYSHTRCVPYGSQYPNQRFGTLPRTLEWRECKNDCK
jgi:hypothetical protein